MRSETQTIDQEATLYPSWEAKAQLWPRRVLPQIIQRANEAAQGADWQALAAWLEAHGLPLPESNSATTQRLAALHEAVRKGRYKSDPNGMDIVYPVALPKPHGAQGASIYPTIEQGGDCDDWAPVILAPLMRWKIPARIVAVGTERDPFAHVFVRARTRDGASYALDPKGNQTGFAFDKTAPRSMFPIQHVFAWFWKDGRLQISQEALQ
jgi:hypothetical protein